MKSIFLSWWNIDVVTHCSSLQNFPLNAQYFHNVVPKSSFPHAGQKIICRKYVQLCKWCYAGNPGSPPPSPAVCSRTTASSRGLWSSAASICGASSSEWAINQALAQALPSLFLSLLSRVATFWTEIHPFPSFARQNLSLCSRISSLFFSKRRKLFFYLFRFSFHLYFCFLFIF